MRAIEELARMVKDGPRPLELRQGIVTAEISGSCTLRLSGSTVDIPGVPRLTSYSPIAGDKVMVLVASSASMLILGTIHG